MKYRVFTYPVPCDEAVAELNSFLSSHRILRVRDEIVLKVDEASCLIVLARSVWRVQRGWKLSSTMRGTKKTAELGGLCISWSSSFIIF